MLGSYGRKRVLIAEDDAIIRMDLREMLEEEGYEVLDVADGASAVAVADEMRPDLVILDIKMPVMDGLTAAQAISDGRFAPVVILTAYSQRELVERAAAAGAMAYLVKPFQKRDLIPAIAIAGERYGQLSGLEQQVEALTGRLEARKIIDKAKGLLGDRYGMLEADAFRFIQQAAMARRVTMADVSRAILDGEMPPPER